jgi:uncharacterized protein YuzE
MKVIYDPSGDRLQILFGDTPIEQSCTAVGAPGLVLDYDTNGGIVGLELLNASQRVHDPRSVDFRETTAVTEGDHTDLSCRSNF